MRLGTRLNPLLMKEEHRFLLLAILIGISAGLVIVCFHIAIEFVDWYLIGTPAGTNKVRTLLTPAIGGVSSVALILFVFRAARGSGVSHTKAALYVSDGHIPSSTVAGKFIACTVSIGSGNSLGPEDPALQMGSGIASYLGRLFRLPRDSMRRIAPVGAAAGIAAAFNTPITAVLFVMEEVMGSWNARVLGSIVLSAVSAVVVSRWFLGDQPLFHVPRFTLTHPSELVVYAAIGAAAGLLGALFTRAAALLKGALHARSTRVRLAAPFVAGLIVGVVALWLPHILGAGYEAVDNAMHNRYGWKILLLLAAAKMLVTLVCFGAGTPGGMFAPTVFTGAMIGGGLGALAQQYWPAPVSAPSAYVLVGIGTFFAAVIRAPMTSVFMVFEVSASFVIIVPVMIANIISYLFARALQPVPFFDLMAKLEGMELPSLEHERERRTLRVEDAMQPPHWPPPENGIPADLPKLYPDLSLDTALHTFGANRTLPVVSRANSEVLVGVLSIEDVHRAYGIRNDSGA